MITKDKMQTAEELQKRKILVVEDETTVLRLLTTYLKNSLPSYTFIEADNGRSALELFRSQSPALMVADVMLPEMDGAALVEAVRSENLEMPILIFTALPLEGVRRRLGHFHKIRFMDKFSVPDVVVKQIEQLINNQPEASGRAEVRGFSQLTVRECTIVSCIAGGRSNKEIAETLGISVFTVETHRKNIHTKLGVHNTAELIAKATALGVLAAGKTGL